MAPLKPGDDGPAEGSDAVRLGRYPAFVKRQWPVLVVTMALGGVLGGVRAATEHHTYTATVTVLAPPVALESGLPPLAAGPYAPLEPKPVLDTMDTEAQLVRSGTVLESLRTVHGFHLPVDRLGDRITVTATTNSRVLTIGVRADKPGNARAGARVIAKSYIKLRASVLGDIRTRDRQQINRRLVIINAELKALPGDPQASARITPDTRREAMLGQSLEARKQLAYTDDFAQVIRSPARPERPDDPGSDVDGTSGVGLGLLGGLVIGAVRDRRPRRLRSPRDIRRRIPLQVLTDVAKDGVADSGRRLRNLAFAEDARTILVTGMPEETADPVAVGVAAAFAHGGAPTTLLRVGKRPVPAYAGGGEPVRDSDLGPFRVETLAADEGDRGLRDAVDRAHRDSGVVVISGPPVETAEAVTLAALADLTFVTVGLKHVTDRPLTAAIEHFGKAGAPPRGIVITQAKRKA